MTDGRKMKMKNYTPHTVTVRADDGREFIYPSSGIVCRVAMDTATADAAPDGCPCVLVTYGSASLPEGETGPCIVSTMFADAYRRLHGEHGAELLVPDSGPSAIRENGQIVAVRALIRRGAAHETTVLESFEGGGKVTYDHHYGVYVDFAAQRVDDGAQEGLEYHECGVGLQDWIRMATAAYLWVSAVAPSMPTGNLENFGGREGLFSSRMLCLRAEGYAPGPLSQWARRE